MSDLFPVAPIAQTHISFRDTTFAVVDRSGTPWLRLFQIGSALGYTDPSMLVRVYSRHADEFTPEMTAIVRLPSDGGEQETRIFSPRGCYALGMFARTKVAKEWRIWVLDVLEGKAVSITPVLPALITTAQAGELATRLAERFPTGKDRPYAWSRFNRHFRLASYRDLPADRFEEACAYIPTMPVKAATPMTPLALSGPIPLPSDPAGQRWLASHGERGWLLREVPANAYVLPISQWTDVIRHEPITDDDLVDLLSAVADRLSPWVRRQPVTPRG